MTDTNILYNPIENKLQRFSNALVTSDTKEIKFLLRDENTRNRIIFEIKNASAEYISALREDWDKYKASVASEFVGPIDEALNSQSQQCDTGRIRPAA